MKLEFLSEPRLIFANGEHICPRRGISAYGVFDQIQETRRSEIYVGGVGSPECMEMLGSWLERCKTGIETPKDTKQENLKLPFCGFSKEAGFGADIRFSSDLARPLKNSDLAEVIAIASGVERIQAAIDLYYENIKFLAQNRHVDVIVCVMPEKLYKAISTDEASGEETLEESKTREELNFRRALKARSMALGKPLQLVRQVNLDSTKSAGQQDDATKAWNFCTALYYKSGPTIPWKLEQESSRVTSCAVGIAFYRSRDRQTLCTSLAQIFDELGNGLILRGTPVQIDKDDRVPRLTAQQSYDLITAALNEYRVALRNFPARVVVHKSSNFTPEEIEGIETAARKLHIDAQATTGTGESLTYMRSLLFAPGSSAKMMAKAMSGDADIVILDLEDSVAPDAKPAARITVAEALTMPRRPAQQVYVRVNPLDGEWCGKDLAAIMLARPDGIMLPKPEGPQDVERLSRMLGPLESPADAGRTRIIAICSETAAGTLSLAAQSWKHPRLAGLLWGAEDLAAALGSSGNRDAEGRYTAPFQLARNLCLLAARAAGVVPIDAVYTDIRNPEGLAMEATAARRDGFSAKAAIHPAQVDVINAAFSYTDAERAWARRVVAALQYGALGAAQMDGMMVDIPHLLQARRILAAS